MQPQNIYIILCRPFSADNIGAAARAMMNMGFSNLRLVSPRRNWRRRARVLARSAAEILEHAETFPNLDDALKDLNWSFGTTRRTGARRGKFIEFESFLKSAAVKSSALKVGLVFGTEAKGLSNAEIERCDQLVSIPSDKAYPSLNLAQAVMVILFALAHQKIPANKFKNPKEVFVEKKEIQMALQHLSEALKCIGFYGGKGGQLDSILWVTESIFKRAGMLHREAQMLKGVSARIIQRTSNRS